MMQTNQIPGFCVIYSMHLISWLLFEKVNEQNLTQKKFAKSLPKLQTFKKRLILL